MAFLTETESAIHDIRAALAGLLSIQPDIEDTDVLEIFNDAVARLRHLEKLFMTNAQGDNNSRRQLRAVYKAVEAGNEFAL